MANDKTLRLRIDDAGRLFCNGHPMEITALKDSAEHVIERGGKEHVIQLKTERNLPTIHISTFRTNLWLHITPFATKRQCRLMESPMSN